MILSLSVLVLTRLTRSLIHRTKWAVFTEVTVRCGTGIGSTIRAVLTSWAVLSIHGSKVHTGAITVFAVHALSALPIADETKTVRVGTDWAVRWRLSLLHAVLGCWANITIV